MLRQTTWLTTFSVTLCAMLGTGCETLNPKSFARSMSREPAVNSESRLAADVARRGAATPKTESKLANLPGNPPSAPLSGAVADSLMAQGAQAERSEQLDQARGFYEQVIKAVPQHAEAHHRLAVIGDRQGRYVDARAHYQLALALTPSDSHLYSDLGYSLYLQDRLQEAEQTLQQALQFDQTNAYAHSNLAQVYQRRAQLSGNPQDLQLAQLHAQLAAQPTGGNNIAQAAATGSQSLNPFVAQGPQSRTTARTPSPLEAPPPNRATQKFMDLLEAERKKVALLQANQPAKERPRAVAPPPTVPNDQIRNVLTQIDAQAEQDRQRMLLESGQSPSMIQSIQPAGAWQPDTSYPTGPRAYHGMNAGADQRGQGAPPQPLPNEGNFNAEYYGPNGNSGAGYDSQPQAGQAPGAWRADAGNPNAPGGFVPSWPQPGSFPTQMNSQGQAWNPQHSQVTPQHGPTAEEARQAAAALGLSAGSGMNFPQGTAAPYQAPPPAGSGSAMPYEHPTNYAPQQRTASPWQGVPETWSTQSRTTSGRGQGPSGTAPRGTRPRTNAWGTQNQPPVHPDQWNQQQQPWGSAPQQFETVQQFENDMQRGAGGTVWAGNPQAGYGNSGRR